MPLAQTPRSVGFVFTAEFFGVGRMVASPRANTHGSYSSRCEQFALLHLSIIP
jgi:hypothetical protein